MVVARKKLFDKDYFQGFEKHGKTDFEKKILDNFGYMRRGSVENDPNFKQPIAYVIIANKKSKRIFAYQRSADQNYTDKRLRGKWSWGIGGHIERIDEKSENPILASLGRELKEETSLNEKITPKVLGYINDDSNDVGKVHFGILYLVETDQNDIKLLGSEAQKCEMLSIEELDKICNSEEYSVEDWSKIALTTLKEVF